MHKREASGESGITSTQMARTKQQEPIRISRRLIQKEACREIRKLVLRSGPTSNKREFQKFWGGIMREQFPGVKFNIHALATIHEAAETWMGHYEGASEEGKKDMVEAQMKHERA